MPQMAKNLPTKTQHNLPKNFMRDPGRFKDATGYWSRLKLKAITSVHDSSEAINH